MLGRGFFHLHSSAIVWIILNFSVIIPVGVCSVLKVLCLVFVRELCHSEVLLRGEFGGVSAGYMRLMNRVLFLTPLNCSFTEFGVRFIICTCLWHIGIIKLRKCSLFCSEVLNESVLLFCHVVTM